MRYGRYGIPYYILRISLGLTFLWIGVDMFRSPDTWIGYIPEFDPFNLSKKTYLQLAGVFDTALGLLLITGNFTKLVALVAALHLFGIIFLNGLDAVLIRDIGLLGSASALFLWPYHHRRNFWLRLFKRKNKFGSEDDE